MKRTPPDSFEPMYTNDADPWGFRTRWYERRRYGLIDAVLPLERYGRCFEPGSSVGELTRRLAARCESVHTLDPSVTAISLAEVTLMDHANVTMQVGALPDDMPPGPFDLVVLSEIGYYFDPPSLHEVLDVVAGQCAAVSTVVACHWRGFSADHLLGGDAVHELMTMRWGRAPRRVLDPDFRCEVWEFR